MFLMPATYAQMTIGSHAVPRQGSLLDLKENDNPGKETNSDKGLSLPRVTLTSPDILTLDEDSKKSDYVGVTVYNVTNNSAIKEGIYCWTGDKWLQTIVVDTKGKDGSILKSNGDGTYEWTTVSFPDYQFHKPTQISTFDASKATTRTFRYRDLVTSSTGKPDPQAFTNAYVYNEELSVKSEVSSLKYLLLGSIIHIKKNTINNLAPRSSFWEQIRIEVFINNTVFKTYERIFITPITGSTSLYIDFFSAIPLPGLGKGNYPLKIRVSNIDNTFRANEGTQGGNFRTSETNFYVIDMTDIGFILFEHD